MAGGNDPYAEIANQFDEAMSRMGDYPSGASPTGAGVRDLTPTTDQKLQAPVFIERTSHVSYVGKDLGDSRVTGSAPPVHSIHKTDVYDAYDEWDRLSDDQKVAFARQLEKMGYIEPGKYDYQDLRNLWNDGVDQAAMIYAGSGRQVTPQGYYRLSASLNGTSADAGQQNGPTKTTSTSSATNFSTKSEARALITDAFRAELGRDPSRREVRAFYRALHAKQRNTPSRSTQTTRASGPEGKRKVHESSTTSGGVDSGAFVQNYIDDRYDTEQDSRAAATEYYDALLGLAGGGG